MIGGVVAGLDYAKCNGLGYQAREVCLKFVCRYPLGGIEPRLASNWKLGEGWRRCRRRVPYDGVLGRPGLYFLRQGQ